MRPELRNLQVNELIVHDIPKKLSRRILRETPDTPIETPVFSQVASPVNTAIVRFFHDSITGTIGSSAAVDVIFDSTSSSPIKQLISDYFTCDGVQRVIITQQIAQYLFDKQNAINSSGLLLFVRCSLRDRILLAILKVEREEGVRVRQQIIRDGLVTFDVEHIRDLMLTKNTRLFKIILFYQEDEYIKGILCDQQRGYSNKDVADFFLSDFLGCKLTEEPQILTKKYFEATQRYINEKVISPEQKGALLNHLISELTDQTNTLNPTSFARRVLPITQQDDYINFMRENGILTGNFPKENCMIEGRLKRIQYEFSSGIHVFGSQEALSEKARVFDLDNGLMKFEIVDGLKQVNSK